METVGMKTVHLEIAAMILGLKLTGYPDTAL
jgi:hypothetical protein